MRTLIRSVLSLAALGVVLAGCGGGGSGGATGAAGGGSSSANTAPKGVNGISVGNCLNDNEDFLVQPSLTNIAGTSPAGVGFALIIYKSAAAAQAAAAHKNPKTTAVVENAVVDFHGNVSPYAGAPPAKISKTELAAIKRCIDASK